MKISLVDERKIGYATTLRGMSKRNVAFIKPDEPSFLQKIKQQIGYKEGPDINTKRQKLRQDDEDFSSDEDHEQTEESPQVVVLKEGDLTQEQADVEKKRIELGKEKTIF